MQVIQTKDGRDHYWMYVKDGRTLYTLQGIVGDITEEPESEQKFSRFFNLDGYIQELVEAKIVDGYRLVDEQDFKEVIVELTCNEEQYDAVWESRSKIEEDLEEFLGVTGNGYFLEDDYGPEAIEFVLYVLDPSYIVEPVVEYFKEQYDVTQIRMGQAKVHYGRRLTGLHPAGKNFNRKN